MRTSLAKILGIIVLSSLLGTALSAQDQLSLNQVKGQEDIGSLRMNKGVFSKFRFLNRTHQIQLADSLHRWQSLPPDTIDGRLDFWTDSLYDKESTAFDKRQTRLEHGRRLILLTDYTSHLNVLGRDYGVKQTGFSETLKAYFTGNLYAMASAQQWTQSQGNAVALWQYGIGHTMDWSEDFTTEVEYSRMQFQHGDEDTKKDLTSMVSLDADYLHNAWGLGVESYYLWGASKSLVLSPTLQYHLPVLIKGEWLIDPAPMVQLSWATENIMVVGSGSATVTQAAAVRRRRTKRKNTTTTSTTTETVSYSNQFRLANVEVQLPLTTNWRNWESNITLHQAFPLNPSDGEVLRAFFYVTGSLAFTIPFTR